MKIRDTPRAMPIMMLLMLTGCAQQPHYPDSMNTYCNTIHGFKTCTADPIPSEDMERDAKRFAPRPNVLTIYLVRGNLDDRPGTVEVSVDGRKTVTTLPYSLARITASPGKHKLGLDDHGQAEILDFSGQEGEVKFVRVAFKYGFADHGYRMFLASGVDPIQRAAKCKLVADIAVP